MKSAARFAARLYPARWRERYGREFEALLDDIDAGMPDVWNVAVGALTMRMTSISIVSIGFAVAGALAGTIVSLRQPTLYESSATFRVPSAAAESVGEALQGAFGPGTRPVGDIDPRRLMVTLDSGGSSSEGSPVLRLASLDPDARGAQRTTQRLVDVLAKAMRSRSTPIAVETLSVPTLPTMPSRPNYVALAGSGGAIGLVLGALVASIQRARAHKINR